ncbi:MAG: hypothetical protein HZA01_15670 [Nitrospinae bacterium]|nr:hypothetical protein [Nitrospinota bacterium]
MQDPITGEDNEKGLKRARKIVMCFGLILVLIGIIRQWPIYGKSYLQFIESDGYLPLMVGIITVILGLSIHILIDDYHEDHAPGQECEKKENRTSNVQRPTSK